MKYPIFAYFCIVFLSFCSFCDVSAELRESDMTYYADAFEGGYTANGDTFTHSGYTVALCDMMLGKNIYAFLGDTGALLRANDRPNCQKYPNIIDTTQSVFSLFAPLSRGRIRGIGVETLEPIDMQSFTALGVQVESIIPSVAFSDEPLYVSGRILDGRLGMFFILESVDHTWRKDYFIPAKADSTFAGFVQLPDIPGNYTIIAVSQRSGEFVLDIPHTIRIIASSQFFSRVGEAISENIFIPTLRSLGDMLYINLPSSIWGEVHISQGSKTYKTTGLYPRVANLPRFEPGEAHLEISGYRVTSQSPIDRISYTPLLYSGSILLDRIHQKLGEDRATLRNFRHSTRVQFLVPKDIKIRDTYFITLPSGDVIQYQFPREYIGTDQFLIPGSRMQITFPSESIGTYMVEVVQESGIAYFNLPVTRGNIWNILREDGFKKRILNQRSATEYVLTRINTLRTALGRTPLRIDLDLMLLAQSKAQDMAQKGYFGHRDTEGNDISHLEKNLGLTIGGNYSENIAYGEGGVSISMLQYGLEDSGSHRHAMIAPRSTKIGVGYLKYGNKTYLVHVIGE